MKTILVSLANLEHIDETLEAAIYIARQNDGHVIGYYPIPGASLIVYASPGADLPIDESLKHLYQKHLPDVKTKFEERMKRSGVKYEWREDQRFESQLTKAILEHGREADIIIMAHAAPGSKTASDEIAFIANMVLGAGRPVLIVPPSKAEAFKADKIAIGWNASREASRAAFDSLPFLENAEEVILAWINPKSKAGKLPGTELAAALARHNVSVTVKGISNRSRTSKAMINMVKEHDIDLLVIGAYGHSRIREQILGGVTEHILKNLPCPVLLAN